MKPRTLRGILILIAICVTALISLRFFRDPQLPVVELPMPPASGDSLLSSDLLGQGQYISAEVTPKTVQDVVGKTLARVTAYSRNVTVERFWPGGSSTEHLVCHFRDGDAHIISDRTGEEKHTLILPDAMYIWYGNSSWNYSGLPSAAREYSNVVDEYSGILTYEELLQLPVDDISDAGYTIYGDESCIWAQYSTGPLGYTSKVYVSIATGLLMGAERYDGDELIYRMSSDVPVTTAPAEELFEIPS